MLDTLAAACAEAGRFPEAVETRVPPALLAGTEAAEAGPPRALPAIKPYRAALPVKTDDKRKTRRQAGRAKDSKDRALLQSQRNVRLVEQRTNLLARPIFHSGSNRPLPHRAGDPLPHLGRLLRHTFGSASINDARVYWEWAGDIAAGKLVLTIRSFPHRCTRHLLGGLRWLGGQLTSVYVLQMLADLAAVVLLGWTCRRRFGAGVALGAVALYLLLLEPASAMLRVLASSLHLLLVVAAWAALVYVQERQSWPRLLAAGAALGLLTVAFAPAILLLPMVAIWLFVLGDRKRSQSLRHCCRSRWRP